MSSFSSFIGNRELHAGEVCDQLQEWINGVFGQLDPIPCVELVLTQYTMAIVIDDRVIWEDQNCPAEDMTLERLQWEYRNWVTAMSKLLDEEVLKT